MKEKLKRAWQWLRVNVINKDMLIWLIIAELIFWSPCIVSGLLALIISPWWWTVFGAVIAFWAGPFTPAMPLQFGLAIGLKKIHEKITKRRNKGDDNIDDGRKGASSDNQG